MHSFQGAGRRLTRTLKMVLDLGCRLRPVQQRNSPGLQRYPTAGVVCRRNLELLLWAIYSICSFPPLHSFNYFLHRKNSSGLQHYPTACVVRRRNLRFPLVQIFFHLYNKGIHLVYSTMPRPVLFAEEILSCFFGAIYSTLQVPAVAQIYLFFAPKEFIWFTALSHGRCCL
jgi:hypothetical protein